MKFLVKSNGRLATLCVSGLMLILSACATAPLSTGELTEARVMARWKAILNGDYAAAYDYLTPAYRSSVSTLQYQRGLLLNQVKWTEARYNESVCEDTTCKVKISIDYTLYGAVPGVNSFDGKQVMEETWLKADGVWYYVIEN